MTNVKPKINYWVSKAFNLPALKKSRLYWVDYLKGIAIILVVYRHSLLGIERSGTYVPEYLSTANMIFYSFRMPLFFMLSGIFISLSLRKRSVKQFVASKFESLIYPYFIWVFIQVTLQIILAGHTNSNRSLVDYTYIFYQPSNLDQFWYLPALFNATVIYLLIKQFVVKKWWALMLIALGFYFLSPFFESISMISDWMKFCIFVALGDNISNLFFQEKVQSFFKNYFTFLLAIPVFIVAQIFYLKHEMYNLTNNIQRAQFLLIALIGCFTMLALSFRLQSRNIMQWLRVFGYHSLYIYVMHVMIAALTRTVATNVFGIHNASVILVLCIISGCVLPVIIYNLFIYNNFAWFLFSFKKKKPNPVVNKPADINASAYMHQPGNDSYKVIQ